jgi:hypothetical protein
MGWILIQFFYEFLSNEKFKFAKSVGLWRAMSEMHGLCWQLTG